MIGPTNEEFEYFFNIISKQNDIKTLKQKQILTHCIHTIIFNSDNIDISVANYEYDKKCLQNNMFMDLEKNESKLETELDFMIACNDDIKCKMQQIINMYYTKMNTKELD